jgi:hypothetical protein
LGRGAVLAASRRSTSVFWRLVEQHVPDYEEKDEWLKENGTRLLFDGSSV